MRASSRITYAVAVAVLLFAPLNEIAPLLPAATAQSRAEPVSILVSPNIRAETAASLPLTIVITPQNSIPKQAMLLIRGVPSSVTLTGGRQFESGVWGVRMVDLRSLKISTDAPQGTKAQLLLSLVTLDGTLLAETNASLTVDASQGSSNYATATTSVTYGSTEHTAAPVAGNPRVAALTDHGFTASTGAEPPSPRSLTPQEAQRMEVFMRKGEELLRTGNIPTARQFFERAANSGWGPAAIAMGGTFDSLELAKVHVVGGIKPEPQTARKWYLKAAQLGVPEAQARLGRLGD